MIPKIIHYCWFGNQPIPDELKTLIEEWQQMHSDFELKLWNEVNSPFDNQYCQFALAQKKWANLSNFVRFHALLQEGGIYLDTDIKLLKPLYPFLHYQCFLGFENEKEVLVNNAVMGSTKGHHFINHCLAAFETTFNGKEDPHESAPLLVTNILKEKYGLKEGGSQQLNDIALFSKDYFYPIHWSETFKLNNYQEYITENTYSIHLWQKSWFTHKMLHNTINEWQFWANELQQEKNRLDALVKTMENQDRIKNNLLDELTTTNLKYKKLIKNLINQLQRINEALVKSEQFHQNQIACLEERKKLEKIIFENQLLIDWYRHTYE